MSVASAPELESAAAPRPGGRRYLSLDGMRGVAAFAVILYHLRAWTAPYTFVAGYLAVDLFFVLSGFVIASSYEARLKSGAMSDWSFLWRRFVRLYPLYILGILLGLASPIGSLVLKGHVIDVYRPFWNAAPFAAAMLPNPGADPTAPLFQIDPPCWSLFFELVANVAYAMTWRLWTTPRLVALVAVLGAVTLWVGGGDQGWRCSDTEFGLLRVFFAFPAGVLIYRLEARGLRLPRTPSWLLLVLLAALLTQPAFAISRASVVFGFPLLVALGVSSEPSKWWQGVCAEGAAISYAVYAVHMPLFAGLDFLVTKLRLTADQFAFGLAFAAALIPIGMAADRIYDAPVRTALSRIPLRLAGRSPRNAPHSQAPL